MWGIMGQSHTTNNNMGLFNSKDFNLNKTSALPACSSPKLLAGHEFSRHFSTGHAMLNNSTKTFPNFINRNNSYNDMNNYRQKNLPTPASCISPQLQRAAAPLVYQNESEGCKMSESRPALDYIILSTSAPRLARQDPPLDYSRAKVLKAPRQSPSQDCGETTPSANQLRIKETVGGKVQLGTNLPPFMKLNGFDTDVILGNFRKLKVQEESLLNSVVELNENREKITVQQLENKKSPKTVLESLPEHVIEQRDEEIDRNCEQVRGKSRRKNKQKRQKQCSKRRSHKRRKRCRNRRNFVKMASSNTSAVHSTVHPDEDKTPQTSATKNDRDTTTPPSDETTEISSIPVTPMASTLDDVIAEDEPDREPDETDSNNSSFCCYECLNKGRGAHDEPVERDSDSSSVYFTAVSSLTSSDDDEQVNTEVATAEHDSDIVIEEIESKETEKDEKGAKIRLPDGADEVDSDEGERNSDRYPENDRDQEEAIYDEDDDHSGICGCFRCATDGMGGENELVDYNNNYNINNNNNNNNDDVDENNNYDNNNNTAPPSLTSSASEHDSDVVMDEIASEETDGDDKCKNNADEGQENSDADNDRYEESDSDIVIDEIVIKPTDEWSDDDLDGNVSDFSEDRCSSPTPRKMRKYSSGRASRADGRGASDVDSDSQEIGPTPPKLRKFSPPPSSSKVTDKAASDESDAESDHDRPGPSRKHKPSPGRYNKTPIGDDDDEDSDWGSEEDDEHDNNNDSDEDDDDDDFIVFARDDDQERRANDLRDLPAPSASRSSFGSTTHGVVNRLQVTVSVEVALKSPTSDDSSENVRERSPSQRRVHFAPDSELEVVRIIEWEDRTGPWEQFVLDTARFRRRIRKAEPCLSQVLGKGLRDRIYRERFATVQELMMMH